MTETYDYVVIGLGALGSATSWQLARRGENVLGLEQFELGHVRGASHDTSRILRRSYHTPAYVRLANEAYGDWAALSAAAGEPLVTVTGGLDLYPEDAAIPVGDYLSSMSACGVPFLELSAAEVSRRWPVVNLPPSVRAVYQSDTAIVPAGHATAVMQRLARREGARLLDQSPVTALVDRGAAGVEVHCGGDSDTSYLARCVVLAADAWTNHLLAHLGASLPLTVTQEQVTYFAPQDPDRFTPGRLPVWIWMDDPSFYGFPTYGEATVKAGQDCGGAVVTADSRSFEPDATGLSRLHEFMSAVLPGSGPPVRTATCLYTLTPDRDFVVGAVPGHPAVLVGLGAGHGFKFAPTIGRILADLAVTGWTRSDIGAFGLDRAALVDSAHPVSWLV